MTRTLLHVLAQRPKLTGSGITLDAFGKGAAESGWCQHAVVGVPLGGPFEVAGIESNRVHPLFFGRGDLDFPVPGMSDVMPYQSTRYSSMTQNQLDGYRAAWKSHLEGVVKKAGPDVILSHHVWIVSALLKDVAPEIPVVTECHATGLRQMKLCPHLEPEVVRGCARNDQFLVLRKDQGVQLQKALGVDSKRIHVVGAGFNDGLFHSEGRQSPSRKRLLYVGKLSSPKGLPWLLDAVETLAEKGLEVELQVAGEGSGEEGDALKARLNQMERVYYHGQVDQPSLADLMRSCHALVLPSFYEGLPLVLVEANACGCRLVTTDLRGVVDELYPHLKDAMELVLLPNLIGVDTPDPADLPRFTASLAAAIEKTIAKEPLSDPNPNVTTPFAWRAVFGRVNRVLMEACES